jgi:ferrous iron transport protein B
LIWFLGYFPRPKATDTEQPISREQIQQDNGSETGGENIQWAGLSSQELQRMEQQKKSYIGRIGLFMEPVLRPLGFDWKISVSLLTGVAAKEIIISTMGVLYAGNPDEEVTSLSERLQSEKYADGSLVFNAAVALSLMVFVLIYFPCVATLAAIRSETGSWKWALFAMSYTILLAWCTAFVVYHLALLFV